MVRYVGLVHKDPDSDYGVSFPDFPGCITAGGSLDEAYDMAVEALNFHITGMQEDGDPIPEPTSLDDILADPENQEVVTTFFIPVTTFKTVRINVNVPETDLAIIDRRAQELGMSRSAFLVRAGKEWRP